MDHINTPKQWPKKTNEVSNFTVKTWGDLIFNFHGNKSTRIELKFVKKDLNSNLMLPFVVFTNVTTLSSKTMNSSILNLLHMNDPSQLWQHLSKIFTSNLDVNWMHKLHFNHWIFCINIGLKLMLQESLENCRFVYNTLLSCSHRKCALGPTYIVYLRCK